MDLLQDRLPNKQGTNFLNSKIRFGHSLLHDIRKELILRPNNKYKNNVKIDFKKGGNRSSIQERARDFFFL